MKKRKIKIALYKNSKTFFGRTIRVQQFFQEVFALGFPISYWAKEGIIQYCIKIKKIFQSMHWKYSHAEIVFCDLREDEKKKISKTGFLCSKPSNWGKKDTKYWDIEKLHQNRIFFSSSETDGGCRFKNIIPKSGHWDFEEIEISEESFQKILAKAISLNGKKYSKWGIIFAQALNLNHSDSDRYFCSQVVSILLHEIYGTNFSQKFFWKYTHFINPRKLSKRLHEFLKKEREIFEILYT